MRARFAALGSSFVGCAALAAAISCSGAAPGVGGSGSTGTSQAASTATKSVSVTGVGSGGTGGAGGGGVGGSGPTSFVYVESNDPAAGANALLGFVRAADGTLTPLSNGPTFPTQGAGLANPTQALGPNDSDQNVVTTPDGHLVFAVNSGSDTVAVLRHENNGALTPVLGSPFSSGGKGPVSLGLAGNRLYVVNRGRELGDVPNYTGFTVGNDGALTPIAGSTVTTSVGASPSQALIAGGNTLVFGTDFMGPNATPTEGTLRAFAIGTDGLLTAAAGTPMAIPASTDVPPKPAFALGLAMHPTQSILYTGFVTYGKVGVYTYGTDGALTFITAVANSGAAVCWMRVSSAGTFLYTVNSGSATVSRYSLTDPMNPSETDHILLKQSASGTPFMDPNGVAQTITSAPFQFEFSQDGKNMYVVSQRVTTNSTDTSGNLLHVLNVATDGSLTEPGDPVPLLVPATARPQGVIQIDD